MLENLKLKVYARVDMILKGERGLINEFKKKEYSNFTNGSDVSWGV